MKKLTLIAGPCAIEDDQTGFEIAEKIKSICDQYNLDYIFKASYRKANRSKNNSFTKLATITTKSLSNAFVNFKKNQEIKKIKEIKLKKLQENSDLIRQKKELKIWEEKLKKEDNKLKSKEEELKITEKNLKSKEDSLAIENEYNSSDLCVSRIELLRKPCKNLRLKFVSFRIPDHQM